VCFSFLKRKKCRNWEKQLGHYARGGASDKREVEQALLLRGPFWQVLRGFIWGQRLRDGGLDRQGRFVQAAFFAQLLAPLSGLKAEVLGNAGPFFRLTVRTNDVA